MQFDEIKDVFYFLSHETFVKWVKSPNKENQLFWEKWLENHPEKKEAFYQAKTLVQNFQFRDDERYDKSQFDRILKNVLKDEYSDRFKNKSKTRWINRNYSAIIKVAAAIALIATFLLLLKNIPNAATGQEIAIQSVIKQNPNGRKSTFMLPDGTIVTLNSNSKITYPSEFRGDNRLVELSGEAFFNVARDPLHPFIVRSKNLETTALGTSFDVQAFDQQNLIAVYLVTGKVRVNTPGDAFPKQYMINPGEQLIYSENQNKAQIARYDADDILWRNGILVFKQSNLSDFINVIERWYDVEVNITGNPQSDIKISGRFDNETLKVVLESLKFSTKINYDLNDRNVKLILNP